MFGFLFRNSAWELIGQSDFFTKIILLMLLLTSVVCIAIIGIKFPFLRRELKAMKTLLKKVKNVYKMDDFLDLRDEFEGSIGGSFLRESIDDLKKILKTSSFSGSSMSSHELEHLDMYLGQAMDHSMLLTEAYLPVLGVSAAVAPLVGLFGTIWGLIHAFVSIGREKSADLSVVAPGIAEALMTTLVGLIVAIPALIFFHYFSNELRKLEQQLGHLSDKFFSVARHTFSK